MTPDDRELVVLLRQAQWLLDDAAHDIPENRYSDEKCEQLADILANLARLVRGRTERCAVIDIRTSGSSAEEA